jgi:carboxypeptidase Taq
MSITAYQDLCRQLQEVGTISSIGHLLGWDQETYMPPAGAAARAEQLAWIAGAAHAKRTSAKLGDTIAACERDASITGDPATPQAACVRESRRSFDRATKLPADLVEEWARTTSLAQDVWKEARKASDFAKFAPWLEKVVGLARRRAECLQSRKGGELYDALLDEYEPRATAKEIEEMFKPLRTRLSGLISSLAQRKAPSTACLDLKIDESRQHAFGLFLLESIGFDLRAGRLDVTTHPFCQDVGPGDTRLTTRYRGDKFVDALFGTMHEAGHGMYEQGLPKTPELQGTPLAESISLGIHESQSRMWENFVGRSRVFWEWALPHAQRMLGGGLERVSLDEMFRAVNTASPSFIRVEADEATYNLHVLVRFEIERGFISGDLKVRDIPGEWNKRVKEYLGLTVPDDRRGCLQDIHWSAGLIGYFPTYTLGNLYAAQLWETIRGQITDLDSQIRGGKFDALRRWLNSNIHAHGKRYPAGDLCRMLTGRPLDSDALMRHLETKLGSVYGGT